ncbi:CPBP family intramembrane glutamic endopeptidase [Streptococcus alactolyticus]|uniref:CPBP family intramembrane glutamic endopeptidase n=1 Tax=Streptococcus alactolyticus TaxID=29389 RepID=UPI001F20C2FB|nr:type II CAAX endopeptidase family protein [Streptococcus alactolyticus]MCF2666249.1 CPBP family intramembrane metalloprotease [Streptococcus alactolyticus]MCF2677974.1 CPBP family intramembrane metalloprotease [Streptococcus alactolyticus]
MKRFVTAVGYFFLAFALIFLEQLPTVFIRANQPFNQTLGITLALLVVSIFTIYVARRVGFLKQLEDLKTWQSWKIILIGFTALTVVKYIGGVILVLEKGLDANTGNQAAIEQVGMSPILLITLTVITAPIVEETVMRGLILGKVFNNSYLGVLLSSFLFGLLHMPTDLGSWIIYGGMGLVLALIYHRTQKLEYTIAVHFINNALGVLFMLLL